MELDTILGPWRGARSTAIGLLLLIAVAGGLDVTTFLFVGGTFVSNQTGTVLLLVMNAAGGETISTPVGMVSLAFFVSGAAVAGRIVRELQSHRKPRSIRWLIGSEAVLVVGAAILYAAEAHDALVVAPLALAMGIQATLAVRLGLVFITGGYVTGSIVTMAMSSPAGDHTHPWWWYGVIPIVVMAAGGALIGFVSFHSVTGGLLVAAGLIATADAVA